MTTFIHDVLKDLQSKQQNLSDLIFVLPSKRAGLFLKYEISKVVNQTIFSPHIISIEEFVEELSELKSISNTELLFEFYTTYTQLTKKEHLDSFESFSKWAQILLQDFNEIDRYLIPQEKIFNYLSAIQDLKHWSLAEHKTDFVKNYLSFWNKLHQYYIHFTEHLLKHKLGYQGLIYRKAAENLKTYIQNNPTKQHVFIGFNALNTSEENIIQGLLDNNTAQIYWDIDAVFENEQLNNTAVVLGDENLLIPVLNSLPNNIHALNVTMGFPLKSIPLATLFDALFQLHKTPSTSFYYKDVINIISHQFIRPLFNIEGVDYASKIIETIDKYNLVYLNHHRLIEIAKASSDVIKVLFSGWENSITLTLETCSKLIIRIKASLDTDIKTNVLSHA